MGASGSWSHSSSAGEYTEDGFLRAHIDERMLSDPLAPTATIAHELGHARLLGERRIDPERKDHELLTDLTTVFFGLGIFTANSARREKSWSDGIEAGWSVSHLGYLDFAHYGYAFAVLAHGRGETRPGWARYLRPNVRAPFKQGQRYLRKREKRARAEGRELSIFPKR